MFYTTDAKHIIRNLVHATNDNASQYRCKYIYIYKESCYNVLNYKLGFTLHLKICNAASSKNKLFSGRSVF